MFERTPLEGLLIYQPRIHRDDRGYFLETFNRRHFEEAGLPCGFVQDNASVSRRGTLRGLHLQRAPFAQTKLVGVTRGKIFDVVVDLRPQSPTLGHWYGITLQDDEHKYVYVPHGFAHGFLALSDTVQVSYKVDNFYNKESEAGLRYDDPDIGIEWPTAQNLVLSDKDLALPGLKEFFTRFPK